MKVKAGALYLSIIIALIIAMICSSLLVLTYYFRLYYVQNQRTQRLQNTMDAGLLIALNQSKNIDSLQLIDLYEQQGDSMLIRTEKWGLFKMVYLQTQIQSDTLYRALLIGNDSRQDRNVIYLSDEDRPLSISGNTQIIGDVLLPKSGIKKAYVDGKPYTGLTMVDGSIKNSTKVLPPLDSTWIFNLQKQLIKLPTETFGPITINRSFKEQTLLFRANISTSLNHVNLKGNIIISSDTTIQIPADAKLDGILIFAKQIRVKSGFKGNCQLFATDSIVVEKDVVFNYPSCLGLLKQPDLITGTQSTIKLAEQVNFAGIIFSHEAKKSKLQTLISIGKNSKIKGEIYAMGILKLANDVQVYGKVSCDRFLMQQNASLYENYLFNVQISRPDRSSYYLSSPLFSTAQIQQKVLKWLE